MSRKLIALLVSVLMIASMAVPAALAEAQPTISLTVWNEPNEDPAMNMYLQAEKATGVKVNVTVIPETEYSSKLNQMVASKSDADIMIVWECDLANFAQANGILKLDDYLAKSTIDQTDFVDAVANLSKGMGATYGLPWCAATEILYYNQDMFDAAGVSYPTNDWSYADFLAAAQKLTQKNADGTTKVYGCTLPNLQTWWAGVGAAGDQVFDPSNGHLVIGDGATKFRDRLRADGQGRRDAAALLRQPRDLFSSGMAAMSWQGSWQIGTYGGNLPFNWGHRGAAQGRASVQHAAHRLLHHLLHLQEPRRGLEGHRVPDGARRPGHQLQVLRQPVRAEGHRGQGRLEGRRRHVD